MSKNLSNAEEFKEFYAEEGNERYENERYEAHLQELHNATLLFLADHVAKRKTWKGYRADLLAQHRDEIGKLRTRAAAVWGLTWSEQMNLEIHVLPPA
jgi:hypothetical protein